ncbi:MAG: glucuronate isomerase [Lachnospiraceae bacterium]|nr:glucuronate isomerase [Lachnospiraceae bacterium]
MKTFLDKDFLLNSATAQKLFDEDATMKKIPVIDYHCHINPREIYEDIQFKNITEVWLGGDHYKWRQMRTFGIEEKYITGDATDYEKFEKWAECMPMLIGNPLYHWSHYELKYYFGYEGTLKPETAKEVWDFVNAKLNTPEFSVRNLIKKSNVKLICTTDDPIDSLEWHQKIKADAGFDVQVLPAWRPDKAVAIEKKDFKDYIAKLSEVSGVEITDYETLKSALIKRLDYFSENGASVSDHGLEYVMYEPATDNDIDVILKKALSNQSLTEKEVLQYATGVLLFLSEEYYKRNWVMQLHYGCTRNNNTYMFELTGPDTGFDAISAGTPSKHLPQFLNAMAKNNAIPKTIVYSLNPVENAAIGTIIGCFQGGNIRSRIQQGSAWWFNDHYEGIKEQLKSLAATSMLGNFVGMLTDSRSFLSYTRHDYFRRILCDLIGDYVEKGEYPNDEDYLKKITRGIAYNNAVEYFGFDLDKV